MTLICSVYWYAHRWQRAENSSFWLCACGDTMGDELE